ncbi:DUF885 domain-containing protein [Microbulbifer variabilis]|uniref:DUF885 domain-containing protein n=1 Tax=Microbulbifer variabilis TaxID=266805 RepID=A0ABY4VEE9_9GAMM|nr:DUF885 domain-containing protein [Microbulbifer variabilis]USD22684.1 DUF885 domain-containing protein [Microbulbifer variabilis]
MKAPLKLLILTSLTLVCACGPQGTDRKRIVPPQVETMIEMRAEMELAFQQLSQQFVNGLWKLFPSWAVREGYYEAAIHLQVPDKAFRAYLLDFAQTYERKFAALDSELLSISSLTDMALIMNFLQRLQWEYTTFKSYQWDPSIYNVSHPFALILNTEYAPLKNRLRTFNTRMRLVPDYYQAAKQAIRRPAAPQLMLAIQQNEGALEVFGTRVENLVESSQMFDDEKEVFRQRLHASREAIKDYVNFLKNLKTSLEKSARFRDFRIGEKLYEEKFRFDIQIDTSASALYLRALEEKQQVHSKMAALTEQLWPKHFPDTQSPSNQMEKVRRLLEKLSLNHASKDTFKEVIEKQIPQLANFVTQHNLLDLHKEKPLIVRTTPPYLRGFAVASINAPGPYDKNANTYYNVLPIENYSDEQANSLLREYNHYTLQILNIHEAIPGHYTQLVYANQSPSIIKTIFGNSAMIEGWAVYAERMMLEAGYGDFSPELWLMYYKWNLRVITNTILDYGVQVKGMTEAEAMNLMVDGAFQQRAEAEGKWRRATLSQVQLTSYFAGFTDILALREEVKNKLGDKFNLKEFHESFLSFGSAPVPIIRELMLTQLEKTGSI